MAYENIQEELKKAQVDSFVFYRSFFESTKELDKEIRLEFYEGVFAYVFMGEVKKMSPIVNALFIANLPTINNALKNKFNGKNGGAPKGNKNAKKTTQKQPKNNRDSTQKQPKNKQKTTYEDVDVYEDEENYTQTQENFVVYGESKNVKLKAGEYEKLLETYSKELVDEKIDDLDKYLDDNPKKRYKDHCRTLLKWLKGSNGNRQNKPAAENESVPPAFDYW